MRGMPASSVPFPPSRPVLAGLPLALAAAPFLLAGCQPGGPSGDPTQAAASQATDEPDADPPADDAIVKKSIIRAEVDTGPTQAPALEPAELTVPFPAKGAKPDAAGMALIDGLLTNPTFQAGGPITIWGHSDSHGSDAENLAASRRRADATRDYLRTKGVPAGRITVIALGESRPVAPNRKLDGSDDPEGRAKNRRVDIKVDLPPEPAPEPRPAG